MQSDMEILFKYYGVTSISMRTALHQMFDDHFETTRHMWPAGEHADFRHPNCIGGRLYFAQAMLRGQRNNLSSFSYSRGFTNVRECSQKAHRKSFL